MSRCETINRIVKEACDRRKEEQRQERMNDYVAAGLTSAQMLAAEKAYFDKYRVPHGMIGMAISCDFPSDGECMITDASYCHVVALRTLACTCPNGKQNGAFDIIGHEFGKSDSDSENDSESEDEKKAVKEKFEDLSIST